MDTGTTRERETAHGLMNPPCDDVLLDNVLETPGTILFFKDRNDLH